MATHMLTTDVVRRRHMVTIVLRAFVVLLVLLAGRTGLQWAFWELAQSSFIYMDEPGWRMFGGAIVSYGAGVLVLLLLEPIIVQWVVPLPGLACPRCGYAVGRGETCPECGLPIPDELRGREDKG